MAGPIARTVRIPARLRFEADPSVSVTALVGRFLDPRVAPWPTAAFYVLAYALALWVGRALLLTDVGIGATWPAVGLAMIWAFPYLQRPRWWRDRDAQALIVVLTAMPLVANYATGMRWPPLVAMAGLCNTVTIVATGMFYLRGRPDDGLCLTSSQDMRRLTLSCAGGIALGWLTFPLVGLLGDQMTLLSALFWAARNGVNLLYGAIGAALFFGRGNARRLRGAGATGVVLACVLTVAFLVIDVLTVKAIVLGYAAIIAAIGVATFFSLAETWAYLLVVGAIATELTVMGLSPFGGADIFERAGVVHVALLTVLLVAMSTAADRESRAMLLEEVMHERAATADQARAAAEQAELLSAIVSSMADGVIVLEPDGRMRAHNAAADALLGVPADASAPRASEEFAAAARVSLREGPSDARLDLGDGASRIVAVQATPLLEGGSDELAVVLRDVSEERRQVAELRTFARVVAHDLRQPMASIGLWTDLLEQEISAAEEAQRAAVASVQAGVARMENFLTDLTNYTVARDGRIAREVVDIGALAEDVGAAHLAGRDDGAVVSVAARDVVEADRTLLRQVLDNLVGNALKYVAPGETPRVEVTSHVEPGWVVIRVDDAGVGIPEGERAAVFDEFHRAAEHRAAYPGTGLGLAICKRIAERHGGRIGVGTAPLGGTRMELRLPERQEGPATADPS